MNLQPTIVFLTAFDLRCAVDSSISAEPPQRYFIDRVLVKGIRDLFDSDERSA